MIQIDHITKRLHELHRYVDVSLFFEVNPQQIHHTASFLRQSVTILTFSSILQQLGVPNLRQED